MPTAAALYSVKLLDMSAMGAVHGRQTAAQMARGSTRLKPMTTVLKSLAVVELPVKEATLQGVVNVSIQCQRHVQNQTQHLPRGVAPHK